MSKLVQFTGVYFPDINSNFYENLNNIKLDLNVSTNVKFSEMTRAFSLKIRVVKVSSKSFALHLVKGFYLCICKNGAFCM